VHTAMPPNVDALDRHPDRGDKRVEQVWAKAGERDHRAVVVRVSVHVEDVRLPIPRGAGDGGDRLVISALGEVGDGLEKVVALHSAVSVSAQCLAPLRSSTATR
jgi:hypothetical protein